MGRNSLQSIKAQENVFRIRLIKNNLSIFLEASRPSEAVNLGPANAIVVTADARHCASVESMPV